MNFVYNGVGSVLGGLSACKRIMQVDDDTCVVALVRKRVAFALVSLVAVQPVVALSAFDDIVLFVAADRIGA